ncbi:hypothetical protein BGAL_0154g00060 [Botrytis galanthina]|uniref:Uncharacterized protein n=1 Tax=Botrytis galanthina TaxID=278940 RepID=A0A4S8QZ74_9HELO|nr:hypothetical protein BGAL_0154g00060 [Botrytis galanthina]
MSHVLPALCLLSQKILRMVDQMDELQEKVLDKDDAIHHWWTRALWAERRVGVLTAEIAGKDVEIAGKDVELAGKDVELAGKDVELAGKDVEITGKDVEIAALNAELAAVRVRIYPAAATLFFLIDR